VETDREGLEHVKVTMATTTMHAISHDPAAYLLILIMTMTVKMIKMPYGEGGGGTGGGTGVRISMKN